MGSQVEIDAIPGDGGQDKPKERPANTTKRSSGRVSETELKDRLVSTFYRIAESLDAKGDRDLADIFEQDAEVMAVGLVNATKVLGPVRNVIVVLVSAVEPVLAFRRIVTEVAARWVERRAARHEARTTETDPLPGTPYPDESDPQPGMSLG